MIIKKVKLIQRMLNYRILVFLFILIFPQQLHALQNRIGGSVVSEFFLDNDSSLFFNATGANACVELGFTESVGVSARIQYVYLFSLDEKINSASQFATLLGGWYRIPVYNTLIFLQPSLEFGIVYQMANLSNKVDMPEKAYTDFIMQLSPSIRFVPHSIFNEKVDLEISPVYTIIPMHSKAFQCLGIRLGAFYRF